MERRDEERRDDKPLPNNVRSFGVTFGSVVKAEFLDNDDRIDSDIDEINQSFHNLSIDGKLNEFFNLFYKHFDIWTVILILVLLYVVYSVNLDCCFSKHQ